MKVAVTGGGGFIGHHVLVELGARAVDSVALLRSSTKNPLKYTRCRVVQFDLQYPPTNAFELLGRPDVLIHLAWSDVHNCKSLKHFEQELPAQYRFLKNLIESGLETLVVAGTCLEYGMQSGSLSEDIVVSPTNPYGLAKDVLRRQLEYLKVAHPFQLVWARLFYTHGLGQPETSLLPQLRCAAERGDQFFNMTGGEQLRDYLPVTEIARHLVSLALAKKDIGVVNVCSGTPISVRKLVETCAKENGWSIGLNLGHYPYADHEPMAFWGDRRKLDGL
jgi:nucleoside-diphosphate-sugar epimerase